MSRRWAILIANDRYSDPVFADLYSPVSEANELRGLLLDPDVGAFDQVDLVVNDSKSSVERALDGRLRSAGPDDLVFIYFSGHGELSSRGRLYLAVTNSEADRLPSTAIAASWVRELLDESDAASTVIVLDCCYGGAFHEGVRTSPTIEANQQLNAGRGRYVLTSANAVQRASDGATGISSPFTALMIEALSTGSADINGLGRITPEDLGRYLRTHLPERSPGQTPTMDGSVQEDVYLARVRDTRQWQATGDHRIRLGDLLGELEQTGDMKLCAVDWRRLGRLAIPIGRAHRAGQPPGEPVILELDGPASHVLIVGRPGSGKSTLLRTLILGLALTRSPDEVWLYCLESGGNRLGSLQALQHLKKIAGDDEPQQVTDILHELQTLVAERKRLFRKHGFASPRELQQLPHGPHPDVFLIIDRWREFAETHDDFDHAVYEIANSGSEYGVRVIVSARRWQDFSEDLTQLAQSRIQLPLGDGSTSPPGNTSPPLPSDRPGWGVYGHQVFRTALPDTEKLPLPDTGHLDDGAARSVARIVEAWEESPGSPHREPDHPDEIIDIRDVLDLDSDIHPGHLRVAIGKSSDDRITALDFDEEGPECIGPHGLVVGAPGSGRAELLRTIIAGLAGRQSPEDLAIALVDSRPSSIFAELSSLPHRCAFITDLGQRPELIDRLAATLRGELRQRQKLLRESGHTHRLGYVTARASNPSLAPMPRLMIFCNEFQDLRAASPNIADALLMIGNLGRTLGMHLLLTSRQVEAMDLRGLDTHLSYRIALRTSTREESRVVLGSADAYNLPRTPGHCLLKTGTGMLQFRAAVSCQLLNLSQPSDPPEWPPRANSGTVLNQIVDGLRQRYAVPADPLWLPPLNIPPTLDQLLPTLAIDPARGLNSTDQGATNYLSFPVGMADKPSKRAQEPLLVDLSGEDGHVAILGGPQSGKTNMLRSLLLALALTHTPREVQIFCLDFGRGQLTALRNLPHVCGVASRLEPQAVRRAITEVSNLLDKREAHFAKFGIESMRAYRLRRAAGPLSDDPFGDVLLAIDGWGSLRMDDEGLVDAVMALASRGSRLGIHVVLTTTRWAELGPSLQELIRTRFETPP